MAIIRVVFYFILYLLLVSAVILTRHHIGIIVLVVSPKFKDLFINYFLCYLIDILFIFFFLKGINCVFSEICHLIAWPTFCNLMSANQARNCRTKEMISMFPLWTITTTTTTPLKGLKRQNTVFTLVYNIHLFTFQLLTCCGRIMLRSV